MSLLIFTEVALTSKLPYPVQCFIPFLLIKLINIQVVNWDLFTLLNLSICSHKHHVADCEISWIRHATVIDERWSIENSSSTNIPLFTICHWLHQWFTSLRAAKRVLSDDLPDLIRHELSGVSVVDIVPTQVNIYLLWERSPCEL